MIYTGVSAMSDRSKKDIKQTNEYYYPKVGEDYEIEIERVEKVLQYCKTGGKAHSGKLTKV